MTSRTLQLNTRSAGQALWAIASLLALAHILAMLCWYLEWVPIDDWLYISFFDLDEEESIGTWFSSLLLFGAALMSFLQLYACDRSLKPAWTFLGFGFIALSLDEIAGFHEFVNTIATDYHWTSFAIPLLAIVFLAMLPLLWRLAPAVRWYLLLAGALYVGGAVLVERATIWHEEQDLLDTLGYNLSTALEEYLEMCGVILYIWTLMGLAAQQGTMLTLRFAPARSEPAPQSR